MKQMTARLSLASMAALALTMVALVAQTPTIERLVLQRADLATPGRDGKACVFCHASHVIFKLEPPNAEGVFSDQDSEENYKFAMRVVNIEEPEKSLMLVKPTRPTDSAGNVGDYLATHNGGQRWHGNESSDQYRTILEWIRGGRLEASNQRK